MDRVRHASVEDNSLTLTCGNTFVRDLSFCSKPELVGKFHTRLPVVSTMKPSTSSMASSSAADVNTEDECSPVDSDKTWCSCDQVESGRMLCCDNENCAIRLLHEWPTPSSKRG